MLKVTKAVSRAVTIVTELAESGQPIALQEVVKVARDIFRRFPNKYEKLVHPLVEKAHEFTEPDSKAAFAWIIGEYCEKIKEVKNLFQELFIENFLEEADAVKLQILTATVKLYLRLPDEVESMIQELFEVATDKVPSPDVRDRAYIYWRMLSANPQAAYDVVLGKKPAIAADTYNIYDEDLVDRLVSGIGSLSSLYHKT